MEWICADASLEDVAESMLNRAANDPALADAFWLLANLPMIARAPGWIENSRAQGVLVSDAPTLLKLTSALTETLDRQATRRGMRSDLGEMAGLALVETLLGKDGDDLPGLFGADPADLRRSLGRFSSGDRFAELSRSFFAKLTGRVLDYYLSRELANHVGGGKRFATDAQRRAVDEALAAHCFEASRIVKEFPGGWYGKTMHREGALTRDAAGRFAIVAFRKLRAEPGRRQDAA